MGSNLHFGGRGPAKHSGPESIPFQIWGMNPKTRPGHWHRLLLFVMILYRGIWSRMNSLTESEALMRAKEIAARIVIGEISAYRGAMAIWKEVVDHCGGEVPGCALAL